jgi:aminobenzoyl-glutamate transport protein
LTITSSTRQSRFLSLVERVGNKLPDPVVLFLFAIAVVYVVSWALAGTDVGVTDPQTGQPRRIQNQFEAKPLIRNMSMMVRNFAEFPPLGIVLVALLGVSVAEKAGLIGAFVRGLLSATPRRLVTPALLLVATASHAAGDTGFVLVVPLGGVIFQAMGRNPVVGVAVAFAGVSGAFSACFFPSTLDVLLQGFTQSAAQLVEPNRMVNPLCNYFFMALSSIVLVLIGWFVTERIVEPAAGPWKGLDDSVGPVGFEPPSVREKGGMIAALAIAMLLTALLTMAAWPADSPLRGRTGSLVADGAPMLELVVPLMVIYFAAMGLVYGYYTGSFRSHRDVVDGMGRSMGDMGYYLVLAFFAAQFTAVFRDSNLGALASVKGAMILGDLPLPRFSLILAIVLLTVVLDLMIGSASAKWAFMAPILIPMLMPLGISPEWTQAAFRVGDSTTNIITPLLPYFPLVLAYARRYDQSVGVGSLVAMTLPFSMAFLAAWTLLLYLFWALGWPLGL